MPHPLADGISAFFGLYRSHRAPQGAWNPVMTGERLNGGCDFSRSCAVQQTHTSAGTALQNALLHGSSLPAAGTAKEDRLWLPAQAAFHTTAPLDRRPEEVQTQRLPAEPRRTSVPVPTVPTVPRDSLERARARRPATAHPRRGEEGTGGLQENRAQTDPGVAPAAGVRIPRAVRAWQSADAALAPEIRRRPPGGGADVAVAEDVGWTPNRQFSPEELRYNPITHQVEVFVNVDGNIQKCEPSADEYRQMLIRLESAAPKKGRGKGLSEFVDLCCAGRARPNPHIKAAYAQNRRVFQKQRGPCTHMYEIANGYPGHPRVFEPDARITHPGGGLSVGRSATVPRTRSDPSSLDTGAHTGDSTRTTRAQGWEPRSAATVGSGACASAPDAACPGLTAGRPFGGRRRLRLGGFHAQAFHWLSAMWELGRLLLSAIPVGLLHVWVTKDDIASRLELLQRTWFGATPSENISEREEEELLRLRAEMLKKVNRWVMHLSAVVATVLLWQWSQTPSVMGALELAAGLMGYLVTLAFFQGYVKITTAWQWRRFEIGGLCIHFLFHFAASFGQDTNMETLWVMFTVLIAINFVDAPLMVPLYILDATLHFWLHPPCSTPMAMYNTVASHIVVVASILCVDHIIRSNLRTKLEVGDVSSQMQGFRQVLQGVCDGALVLDREDCTIIDDASHLERLLKSNRKLSDSNFLDLFLDEESRERFRQKDCCLLAMKEDPDSEGRANAVPDALPGSVPSVRLQETGLLDIEEAHLRFCRQSMAATIESGMPTLRRFIRPTDWDRIEGMLNFVLRLPPEHEREACYFRKPMLFRLPGESRSYLCAKSASISVADPTIEVGQPVRFWMHLTSFTANHLQKPRQQELEDIMEDDHGGSKEEGRAAAQLLATSTSTNSTGCMGTDPGYDPNDEEDFKVAPVRKFDSKADYYKLLEVDDFASVKDIKGAYKKLALQYHPDSWP
eukprot:g10741.t1